MQWMDLAISLSVPFTVFIWGVWKLTSIFKVFSLKRDWLMLREGGGNLRLLRRRHLKAQIVAEDSNIDRSIEEQNKV